MGSLQADILFDVQLQRLKSVKGPSSPQLAAQKSFASHSSLTDTDDEEDVKPAPRAQSISNAAVCITEHSTQLDLMYMPHVLQYMLQASVDVD